jgi:hypothetical protein
MSGAIVVKSLRILTCVASYLICLLLKYPCGSMMVVLAFQIASERRDLLIAVAVLCIIGVALIVLAPAKKSGERALAAGA